MQELVRVLNRMLRTVRKHAFSALAGRDRPARRNQDLMPAGIEVLELRHLLTVVLGSNLPGEEATSALQTQSAPDSSNLLVSNLPDSNLQGSNLNSPAIQDLVFPADVAPVQFDFPDFSDLTNLQLNGSATQIGDRLRLTNTDTPDQVGSFFYNQRVSTATSFSTHFQFDLSNGTTPPGEGFAFVMQNEVLGPATIGGGGAGLGFDGLDQSYAVIFDLLPGPGSDANDNEVGIASYGFAEGTIVRASPSFRISNAGAVNVWIDYDASGLQIQIYVSDTAIRPVMPLINQEIFLSQAVGNSGYVGFTGSTSAKEEVQSIQNWSFDNVNGHPNVAVIHTAGRSTSESGASDYFQVYLTSKPTSNVIVPLINTDPTEGSLPVSQLVFTPDNWDTLQTVYVTGADDSLQDGDVEYVIQTGLTQSDDPDYNGLDPFDVILTNTDDPNITFSAASGVVTGNQATVIDPGVAITSDSTSFTEILINVREETQQRGDRLIFKKFADPETGETVRLKTVKGKQVIEVGKTIIGSFQLNPTRANYYFYIPQGGSKALVQDLLRNTEFRGKASATHRTVEIAVSPHDHDFGFATGYDLAVNRHRVKDHTSSVSRKS
ncbi:MAG: gdhB 2 [Planctomycetaceae bacterium]|nr:gdhB 2 [Planctomycetaceae bacterium]